MRVSADINNNYLFVPSFNELVPFVDTFKDTLKQTAQGYTYGTYNDVPKAIVKDSVYFGATADKTRSFNNEQSLLHYLKLGLNGTNGEILDASEGLVLNKSIIKYDDKRGYMADHIPVLYSLVPFNGNPYTVIVGFAGDFSFLKNVFIGQVQYQDIRTLWNE